MAPRNACADVGRALQRLAIVDLLHGKLSGMQLLYAVDGKIAALVLDEAELHWPGLLRPAPASRSRGDRLADPMLADDAGGRGAFDQRAAIDPPLALSERWHFVHRTGIVGSLILSVMLLLPLVTLTCHDLARARIGPLP